MTFLNPLFLLGVLGVSVPIVVHLLNRFRPRRLEWGAMELLRRAIVTRARQVKLEDLLLLLLRCLAIALLALAMARPTLSGSAGRMLGADHVGAVIAIDGSMSMEHQPGVHSRQDRAIESVHEILDNLEPGSPLSLVMLGEQPEVLHHGRYDPELVATILEELEPRPERLNVARSLEAMAEQLELLEAGALECYLVTDLQAVHWAEPSAVVERHLTALSDRAGLMLVPVGDDRHENLAIESLVLEGGALRVGATARYRATVRNTGAQPRHDVTVQLLHDERPSDVVSLDSIEPGATGQVSFALPFERAGIHRLSARLERDELQVDNIRYAVAEVRERVRVLVASGRPASHWSEDAAGFVMRGIQPRADLPGQESLEVQWVDWMDLPVQPLSEYDVVVLADVPDVAEAQVDGLRRFVKAGGGLVLVAGSQIEPALFNARLASGDASLSPARLSEWRDVGEATEGGVPLRVADGSHPLARPATLLSTDLLDEARLRQYFTSTPLADSQVVLRVADEDDSPLLIERRLGQGRVLLWTTGAQRTAGDLVIHPVWPMVWQLSMTTLTQAEVPASVVGQPLTVTLAGTDDVRQMHFAGPHGQSASLTPLDRGDHQVATLPRSNWPGFYEAQVDGEGGETWVRAVNVDTVESNVRAMERAGLAAAWPTFPGTIVDEGASLTEAIRRMRVGFELWRILLGLALAVLAVEAFLARRFTKRMASGMAGPRAPMRRASPLEQPDLARSAA
ncbi:MAG: BatA domain-containing protein [Phycisphaeraceae bacterium]